MEEKLQSVPDGQRVHIDKELLDDLIFFKVKDKDGILMKFPVWTGQFLRKIDLSELSFENVLFGIFFERDLLKEVMDAEDVSRFIETDYDSYQVPLANDNGVIDFSYTNADIDFSKIYHRDICDCDFEGLDFSKANGESINCVDNSNFSNTNIRLDFNKPLLTLWDSDFSNNDFSYATVDAKDIYRECIKDSNFSNTGLNINYVARDIPPIYYELKEKIRANDKLCEQGDISKEDWFEKYWKYHQEIYQYESAIRHKQLIGNQIKKGYLDGCSINGKRVLSLAERQANAQQKKAEYEKIQEDLIYANMSSIEQQISDCLRK